MPALQCGGRRQRRERGAGEKGGPGSPREAGGRTSEQARVGQGGMWGRPPTPTHPGRAADRDARGPRDARAPQGDGAGWGRREPGEGAIGEEEDPKGHPEPPGARAGVGGGGPRPGGGRGRRIHLAARWNLSSQHASTTWEPEGSRCAAESLGLILCTIKHSAASPSCSYTSSTLNKHNDDIRCNSR